MTRGLEIIQCAMACVQDLGRPAGGRLGLPANGALDQFSFRAANILVRNAQDAPAIEITAMDFVAKPTTDSLVAVTGAPAIVTLDGIPQNMWTPISMRAGQRLKIHRIHEGLRVYVGVYGSFDVPHYAGSCAPDSILGFGTILSAGMVVPLNALHRNIEHPFLIHPIFRTGFEPPSYSGTRTIDVTAGPDEIEFGDSAQKLYENHFVLSERSNAIGMRLTGELPVRQSSAESLSRGVPVGAIEVPPGNELLILHRGRGVTAGYPVLAVASASSLNRLAQVRPGTAVSFRKVSLADALRTNKQEHEQLKKLEQTISSIFTSLAVFGQAA